MALSGFKNIFQLPYFWTPQRINDFFRDVANNAQVNNLLERLDTLNEHSGVTNIITGNWKDLLQNYASENSEGETHYQEMMVGYRGKDKYNGEKPSNLICFIRHTDQHAPGKISARPRGFLDKQLFKNGYEDKNAFVQYWVNLFPNLLGGLWAVKHEKTEDFNWNNPGIPDQIVAALLQSRIDERNRGGMVYRMQCKIKSGSVPFMLEVYQMEGWTAPNIVVECQVSFVVTQNNGEVLRYNLTNTQFRGKFVIGLHNLFSESEAPLVVLFVNPDEAEQVNEYVSKSAICEHKPVNWSEISDVSKTQLLGKAKIMCQDQEYSVRNVDYENLEGYQLNSLLKQYKITLFSDDIANAEKHSETYLPRWFELEEVNEDFFIDPDTVFLLISETTWGWGFPYDMKTLADRIVEIEDFISCEDLGNSNIITTPGPENYTQCYKKLKTLAGDRQVVMLKYVRKMPCSGVRDDYSTGFLPVLEVERLVRLIPERELVNIPFENKLIFIHSGPGDGKTSLLQNLYQTVSIANTYIVFFSAKQLLDRMSAVTNTTSVIDTIIGCLAKTKFEMSMLKRMKIVLLLDAIDEVEEKHFPEMEPILQFVWKNDDIRIISTVRSYLVPLLTEKYGLARFLKLEQIDSKDQVTLVTQACENLGLDRNISMTISENYVETWGAELEFTLSPLLCKLLGEFCADSHLKGELLLKNYSLNILDLYKHIVEKLFQRYVVDKKRVPIEVINQDMFVTVQAQYIAAHVFLAMKELHPEHVQSVPTSNLVLTPGQGFLANIDPVCFTHRTFAEYFLDQWVFEVISGISAPASEHFIDFFKSRYIESSNVNFLHTMLTRNRPKCLFPFRPGAFDIRELASRLLVPFKDVVILTLIDSFHSHSNEKFKCLLLQNLTESVNLSEQLQRRDIKTIPLICLLYVHAANHGSLGVMWLLAVEMGLEFQPVVYGQTHYATLLHAVLQCSANNNSARLNEKKHIIDFLMKFDANMIHVCDNAENTCFLVENINFELLQYIADKLDPETRAEVLTQTNMRKENILHRNNFNDRSVEFMCEFQSKYPAEFYELVNSCDIGEDVPWMQMQTGSTQFTDVVLRQFDFCILRPSIMKPVTRSDFFDFTTSSRHRNAAWRAQVCIWSELSRTTPANFNMHSHGYDEGWFELYFPEYAIIEQRIYTFLEFLCDSLLERPNSLEIQTLLVNEVLSVEGISFKHSVCCYTFNKIIEGVQLEFQLRQELVSSMCTNDSPFIVACKTGHLNIAKIFASSFTSKWIRCLNGFETFCFFRALDQHCGQLLYDIVRRLEAEDFRIPARPVEEALKNGNINLLKLYIENFHFSEYQCFGKNGSSMLHVLVRNSCFDKEAVVEGKLEAIKYLVSKFPGCLEFKDSQGRVPMMNDRISNRLNTAVLLRPAIYSPPERKSMFQRIMNYFSYLRAVLSWVSRLFFFI